MSVAEKIERILDEEKKLLLKGDFLQLEKIADLKMKMSEIITTRRAQMSAKEVQRIARKARDNESLLESAQRGIQAAMRHLRESSEGSFQSYSRDGQREPLSKSKTVHQRL